MQVTTKGKSRLQHGQARVIGQTPEYAAWVDMKKRCYGEYTDSFNHYGGNEIKVCANWLVS